MLDHVLVSLDYSSLSEKALPYALDLVSSGGKLTLLIVIEDIHNFPVYSTESATIYMQPSWEEAKKELYQRAKLYLERVTSELPEPLPKIEHIVRIGSPADMIIDFAKCSSVDMIVMCTHGYTGFSRWLIGSVSHKVINATPCPIMVIPGRSSGDVA